MLMEALSDPEGRLVHPGMVRVLPNPGERETQTAVIRPGIWGQHGQDLPWLMGERT